MYVCITTVVVPLVISFGCYYAYVSHLSLYVTESQEVRDNDLIYGKNREVSNLYGKVLTTSHLHSVSLIRRHKSERFM